MRIIDLSLTMRPHMRGIAWDTAHTLANNEWNARTLHLYSHATTHMDAHRHFFEQGHSIEHLYLAKSVGPAWVIDVGVLEPCELITVNHLCDGAERIEPGDRVLLPSCWSARIDIPTYRDDLPRISVELSHFFAKRLIALVGVEPLSVAAVDDIEEITVVHQNLLQASIVIVEGLTKMEGCDGTSVRAIVIESFIDKILP